MNHHFYIVGAESTGKSTLTHDLSLHFGAPGIDEFARGYLEKIGRPYTFADLEQIARGQLNLIFENQDQEMVFFDTDLNNIKIWFQLVYSTIPDWFTGEMKKFGQGTYLVCQPDIPWVPDPFRENPDRRDFLNDLYEKELELAGFPYFRISGFGNERLVRAINIVKRVIATD
ncbi:MAG: ATP-binding protein [Bacteroidota bacterium]